MAKKRKKRKRESYLEQVIYAHENGEDASGGYVFRLIGGFILDFFQTVKFPKFWDHGQKKQETEAKKDHE